MNRTWMLLASASLLLPSAQASHIAAQALTGWQLTLASQIGSAASTRLNDPKGEWIPAVVPGTIITSLERHGAFQNPLYGTNILAIPEVLSTSNYWYRTTFKTSTLLKKGALTLRLNGINYRAEVWLNGHDLGTIMGAFARKDFEVAPYVHPTGMNVLAVNVTPQPHPGLPHLKTIARGTGRNGGITAIDGPTFFCSIGWDWIPTIPDRDTGIWQSVELIPTGPVKLKYPFVTSDVSLHPTPSSKETIEVTAENVSARPVTARVTGKIGVVTFSQSLKLSPYQTKVVRFTPSTFTQLNFPHPRLWWPNGYGSQPLYTLKLSASVNSRSSDTIDSKFGIRKIAYSRPGSKDLTIVVNGVPIVAKGGDWGMDDALKQLSYARMDAMIRMHKEANYTIIRNWCGQSTSPLLYDLCDKYGILLWDEFFQPNPSDGPNPTDAKTYLANVRGKILEYRNHPSIALWCARNEGDPPANIGDGIQALINRYDSSRLYQPSSTSGRGVRSGGPYFWRVPEAFYNVDAPFKTEIGSMSVPTLQSICAFLPKKDWNVVNDDWALHDFCAGAQRGDHYIEDITNRYGAPHSLADFVRKAQMMNYEAFRAMYEGRLCQLLTPTTGIITWMSNPAQNSFVWQIYSHDLEPNASLFGAKEGCEPLHVMLNQKTNHIEVVNGTSSALNQVNIIVDLFNLQGQEISTTVKSVSAPAESVSDLGTAPNADIADPIHFLRLRLMQSDGKLLSSNFYWLGSTNSPDNLTALDQVPTVKLKVTATKASAQGKLVVTVHVSNPSKTIALMAHFQLRDAKTQSRVLPAFYSENYISLVPGEAETITIHTNLPYSAAFKPEVAIDGWNTSVEASPSGNLVKIISILDRPSPTSTALWPLSTTAHP